MEKHHTPAEIAESLQVSERFVRDRANDGRWPCLHFGNKTIRFTDDHVQQILDMSERTPESRNTRTNRRDRINRLIA